jgi:hypothetical protein
LQHIKNLGGITILKEMKSEDPIHDYIMKASSEDLKDMMEESGLNSETEAKWVSDIVKKHLKEKLNEGEV